MVRPIIGVDFDGVCNSYKSGFTREDDLPDPPVDGAPEKMNEYAEHFSPHIFSARAINERAVKAIQKYLKKWGFPPHMPVSNRKPHGKIYIDDRGFQFNGVFPSIEYIRTFQPWYKRGDGYKPVTEEKDTTADDLKQLLDENSERLGEKSGDRESPVLERVRNLLKRIAPSD